MNLILVMLQGRGGVYLEGEFDGGKMDFRWSDGEITRGGGGNGMGGKRGQKKEEEEEEEEESFDPNVMPPKGASLGGALL
jgi:hypothetical protein